MATSTETVTYAGRNGILIELSRYGLAAFALFHVYTSIFGTFDPLIQRSVFIGFGVALSFLVWAAASRSAASAAFDVVLAIAVLAAGVFVIVSHDRLMDVMEDLTIFDKVLAVLILALVIESTRRSIGLSMPLLSALAIAYLFFGREIISGQWAPPAISAETGLRALALQTTGVFGYLADIGTRVIAIYVIFGSVLMATGGGEIFMRTATLVAGRSYGGPAKVAVISSALFGTISGSAVANVMAVGTMTIPTMARAGYPKSFAAGVEATASAGGQIMPPIMGAGAFIMAEWLNIPYSHIAIAATLPALLYFGAVFFAVDAVARRDGLMPVDKSQMPKWRDLIDFVNGVPTFGSIAVLIGFLFADYTPTVAGAAGTISLIGLQILTRIVPYLLKGEIATAGTQLTTLVRQVMAGIDDAARGLLSIAVLLGCAGVIVTVLGSSGIAVKFSSLLVSFAGVSMIVLLILSAILCILLGMDVPTTASYVIASSVAAPALVALGLPPLSAHLFIFYFAILSAITPPVCSSVFAAATIANESFWKVASHALRIGAAIYFIPFMFVYRPALLTDGSALEIAYHLVVSGAAILAMTGGMMAYYFGRASGTLRLLLLAIAAVLFYPSIYADLAGLAVMVLLALWQRYRTKAVAAA